MRSAELIRTVPNSALRIPSTRSAGTRLVAPAGEEEAEGGGQRQGGQGEQSIENRL
jgi:hypothetical protein